MSFASSLSRSLRATRPAVQHPQINAFRRPSARFRLASSSQRTIPSHSQPSWSVSGRTSLSRRPFSSSLRRSDSTGVATGGSSAPSVAEPTEPRLQLTFTCTVENCAERSTHEFTKRAYEKGIVLVTCPKCKNRHLIADHIGWFKETEGTDGGQLKTVEDLMRAKGEKVTRGRLGAEGVVEFVE